MQPDLVTPRQRRVANTVTWFAVQFGNMHRFNQNLGDPYVQDILQTRVNNIVSRGRDGRG